MFESFRPAAVSERRPEVGLLAVRSSSCRPRKATSPANGRSAAKSSLTARPEAAAEIRVTDDPQIPLAIRFRYFYE